MNPFELAKQKRLEQQEAEKRREEEKKLQNYSYSELDSIQWMGLSQEPKALRILGYPYEVREKPTDVKLFYWSKIVNDTGKNFVHVFWKTTNDCELDENWIFYRLWKKVTEVEWVSYKEGEVRDPNRPRSNENGYFVDKYAGTPSFMRLEKNKKEGSNQFGHVYPKKRFAANVIDRMDDWCKQNKHSKLLSSSHTPFEIKTETGEKKTIYFTDKGAPFELYKLIFSQILEFRGTWDLDIAVWKEEKKYIIRDVFEDKIKKEVKDLMSKEPLTEEEKAYSLYDLDEIFKPTGYYKLYNSFEKLFKQVDLDLGSKFHPELVEYYEVEKLEREKEKKETELKSKSQQHISSQEEKQEKLSRRKPEESIENKLKAFPNWNKLTDSDKACLLSKCIGVDGESFRYKENTSLLPCECEKKIDFPDEVFNCIICGKNFS